MCFGSFFLAFWLHHLFSSCLTVGSPGVYEILNCTVRRVVILFCELSTKK